MTVGITTEFSKLQARRVASLVRLAADRHGELHEHARYADEAARLLKLAQTIDFDFRDQASRWQTWARLDATDLDETPEGPAHETIAQRRNRERKDAEAYAKRVLIPRDRKTGVRFVHAGWFQQFMRLQLGASATPQRTRQALLDEGWQVRGRAGRIKATPPDDGDPLILTFYLVSSGWEIGRAGPGEDR